MSKVYYKHRVVQSHRDHNTQNNHSRKVERVEHCKFTCDEGLVCKNLTPVIFVVITLEFLYLIIKRGPSAETSEHHVVRVSCDSYT